jgi:hypothetical protein
MTQVHFTKWDRFCRWLAFKLPKRVVYHAYIRLHAYATSGDRPGARKHPDETTWSEAVAVWEKR